MTQLKITITPDILKRSMYCTTENASENCAIALAVQDIFPGAAVGRCYIHVSTGQYGKVGIVLPHCARNFIDIFDVNTPEKRMDMPEFSFNVSIPDKVIDTINIDEIHPMLVNHPTLQLV